MRLPWGPCSRTLESIWTPVGYFAKRLIAEEKARTRMHVTELVMVARDGIEPPTPAFSGLRSTD
jgi:hypothetical protein